MARNMCCSGAVPVALLVPAFAVVLAFTVAAPAAATTISDLSEAPRDYVGDELRLRGEVVSVRKVPLVETWIITVYDRTGSLIVITGDEYEVSDRFRGKVKVLGIATAGAEEVSEKFADDVADFLVEKEIFERNRADRGADAVVGFLHTVLPLLDTSLCALEVE